MFRFGTRSRHLLFLIASVCALCTLVAVGAPSSANASLILGDSPTEVFTASGQSLEFQISGWAADPDVRQQPIDVGIDIEWFTTVCYGWVTSPLDCTSYPKGQVSYLLPASAWDWDLVQTIWGPYHGFSLTVKPPAGVNAANYQVTAYNVGAGSNTFEAGGVCIPVYTGC